LIKEAEPRALTVTQQAHVLSGSEFCAVRAHHTSTDVVESLEEVRANG